MLPLTVEHNYPIRLAHAKILHGWAVAATGAPEAGLAQVRDGIGDERSLGVGFISLAFWVCWLSS